MQLADVDKFTYLRSSTAGEALQELNSVELTGDNYEVAWKLLEKKYENRKLIVRAHLDSLFAVEPMRKESCEALSHIISEFDKNLLMLKKIGEQTDNWSTILAYMVCSRLDSTTLRHWETHHNSKEVPKYEDLMQFLRDQCAVLQSIAPAKAYDVDKRQRSSTIHTSSQFQRRCLFCGDSYHLPFKCSKLQIMTVAQRADEINRKRLCRNCLSTGHFAEGCSRGSCTRCGRNHHTMLHFERSSSSGYQAKSSVPVSAPPSVPNAQNRPNSSTTPAANQQQSQQSRSKQQSQTQTPSTQPVTQAQPTSSYPVIRSQNTHPQPTTDPQPAISLETTESLRCIGTTTRQVLMSTAIVKVVDRFGNIALARTLLDSCSEFCYMTSGFSKRLKFHEQRNFLKVQGIGNSSVTSSKSVEANIEPRHSSISSFGERMQFHVLPKITQTLPLRPLRMDLLEIPSDVMLADPTFGEPGPIDMIIGAEFYFDLLRAGRRKLFETGPTLQETVFGWVVSGKVPEVSSNVPTTSSYVTSTVDLQELIARFWELETCHVNRTHSVEETACEEFFNRTTIRDEDGRFVVTIPKKEHMLERLGQSKDIAMKRFIGLEKRFALNNDLKEAYKEFIHEYILMGHMKEVDEKQDTGFPVYYMPHHAVLRPDSTTTKLRVVFDASCRTSSGISLNDTQMVGPVIQNDLITTILRFRHHRIAVIADVAKMYRMVRVPEQDQHLQRILWRDTPEEPVKTFELLTVTYGTASAPYLATRCLKKLGEDSVSTHPIAAQVVQEDFYVDDMLSGADTVSEAQKLMDEVIELTNSVGFTLRKWNSNAPRLLAKLPTHLRDERSVLDLDSSSATVKTLGLRWDTQSDYFCFTFPEWRSNSSAITKRSVHSDAACFFDPLGLVGPVVVQAKIFIQRLWLLKCDWDEPLEESLQILWQEYNVELDPALLEERPSPALAAQAIPPSEIFGERSSFTELVRIVALLLRFRHNSQKGNRQFRKTGCLSLQEQEEAIVVLVRLSQQECYPQELRDLAKNGCVKDSSNIAALHPRLFDGVMRVGGRLSKAPISSNRKHPYILHNKHPFAAMIVRHYHHKLFHAGQQLLISAVRGKFWPVHLHSLARRVIHSCIPCFRNKPKVLDQIMADLPSARVTPAPAFLKVGVDYCGPFFVNYPNRRASPVKCYVAIFVCLVVKAIHLELVMDLTSQAFLAALKRFTARRGRPQLIMCDNATTFVGAKRELTELHRLFHDQRFQAKLIKDTSSDGIEFRFIPPRTPNFGGLWEAQVKSFKGHFKKAIGTKVLKVDEMLTALYQIEAVLNSRPLTPLSNDPKDFEALTPGHFLVQRPLTAIPEPDLQDVPSNRLSKWENVQQLSQQVWKKWSTQYLSDLHNRTKWTKQRNNISVGTMVLLKEENAPPLKWHLGRVIKVFEGSDDNIRVVTVRTKDGCFDRGISKVCLLPIRDNEELNNLQNA